MTVIKACGHAFSILFKNLVVEYYNPTREIYRKIRPNEIGPDGKRAPVRLTKVSQHPPHGLFGWGAPNTAAGMRPRPTKIQPVK